MHEQNFENRVRDKLGGLLLDPSLPVWKEVEKELAKKKRRRGFFFFLFLLVPVATCVALYLGGTFDSGKESVAAGSHKTTGNAAVAPTVRHKKEVPLPGPLPLPSPSISAAPIVPGFTSKRSAPEMYAARTKRGLPTSIVVRGHSNEPPSTSIVPTATGKKEGTLTLPSTVEHGPPLGVDEYPPVRKGLNSIDARRSEPTLPRSLTLFTPSFNKLPGSKPQAGNKKWQWSLHAAAGSSWVRTSLFHDVPQVRADFQTGSAAGGTPASRLPSTVKRGGVYTVGIDIKKPLAPNLSFVTGLRYRRAQTRVTVGTAIARDTTLQANNYSFLSVSQYYNAGSTKELTNNYHFLEVPVGLELQPLERVPLSLQTTLSAARMIAANAVVFGTQSRVYYKEKSAYHNTQLYLGTAIDYRLVQTKGFTLRAGPYLHYGITTLEKRGWVDQHLFAAGIRTNISF
jgi:hypothetical protein